MDMIKTDMTKEYSRKKTAFTFIEMAASVVVIGIIIGFVIGGQNLVSLSRLSSARALTNASVVNDIDNVTLWLETTSKASFEKGQAVDGNLISQWNDIAPKVTLKHNVTQATPASQPIYVQNGINNLAALRFSGPGYTMENSSADGFSLVNDRELTLFMVAQDVATGSSTPLILSVAGGSDRISMHFFYSTGKALYWDSPVVGGRVSASFASVTQITDSSAPAIWCYVRDGANGHVYYNGEQVITSSSLTAFTTISRSMILEIGLNYNGFLGEVILFDRVLGADEQDQIEEYLSKKWKIDLL